MTTTPKRLIAAVAALGTMLAWASGAQAQTLASYTANTPPTTQGFGPWPYNGSFSTAPLNNDLGHVALQIQSTGSSDEQAYYTMLGGSGPFGSSGLGSGLTTAQASAIVAQGFTVSFLARVVQGPALSGTTGHYSASVQVDGFNGNTYDVMLGTDGSGNTTAVLPTLNSFDNTQLTATWAGSPSILAGQGYHLYQLSYDPSTQTATLYGDGVELQSGFTGSSIGANVTGQNYGLVFGAANDATVNFASVSLAIGQVPTVPEPSSLVLLAAGAGLVLASRAGSGTRSSRGSRGGA